MGGCLPGSVPINDDSGPDVEVAWSIFSLDAGEKPGPGAGGAVVVGPALVVASDGEDDLLDGRR